MIARQRHVIFFALLVCLASVTSLAQSRKKIAIFPFDDRTTANQTMNIGVKVSDALISKLTQTGAFEVVDREYLNTLLKEKNMKFDSNFNAAGAAKSGLLGVVDIVIVGQIDSFDANVASAQTGNYISKKTKVTGTTGLKVTARLISVERGSILSAPSSGAEKSSTLAESSTSLIVQNVGNSSSTVDTKAALEKLVDETVDSVTSDLSSKISVSAAAYLPAPAVAAMPKFVGVEDGLVVVNKGTGAGIKIGDKFAVVRPTDTGMKDPDTGVAIIRKKRVCSLTISVVEDSISSGSCDGGVPEKGDEIAPVPTS